MVSEQTAKPEVDIYLNIALLNNVKVVSLISLLNDTLSCLVNNREHGIKNVRPLAGVQVRKEDALFNRLGQLSHRLVILRDNLK